MVLNQIGRRLTESLEQRIARRRLLMMLDEFPALGRLDFFESALAFMAGYGLRAVLIAQSLNQIEKAYGPNNAILDNCHIRVAFSTNDERTARRISDALGTATELRAQKNYAGHRLSPWLGHLMVSRQETARPLLTPGEVMQLPVHEEIVMVSGHPPVRAVKLRYFEDENFTARVLPPPSMPLPSSPEAVYPDRPAHRPDDWTGRPLPPAPVLSARWETDDVPDPQAPPPEGGGGISRVSELEQLLTQQKLTLHQLEVEDSANEPRLSEFDDESDEHDPTSPLEPHTRERSDPALTRAARLAALDPDDGIPL